MKQRKGKSRLFRTMREFFVLFSLFVFTLNLSMVPGTSMSKYVLNDEENFTLQSGSWSFPLETVEISGVDTVGQSLTVSALMPLGATASYQWQRKGPADTEYSDISGAAEGTYTLTVDDYQATIRLLATGIEPYSGTVASPVAGLVAQGVITGISPIVGSAVPKQTLTAGTVTPLGATVTYQWQRSSNGKVFTNITDATKKSYKLVGDDNNRYLRVVVTGNNAYTGTAVSDTSSLIKESDGTLTAIGPISGTARVGSTLNAGQLTPSGASVTFQWQRGDTPSGTFSNIPGAVYNVNTLTGADYGWYIRLVATASASYLGTVSSAAIGPVGYGQLVSIGDIKGAAAAGETLTAGDLNPPGATVSWQWKSASARDGVYEVISGATLGAYALTSGDIGTYFKLEATGTGYFLSSSVQSEPAGPVTASAIPITAIGEIMGTPQVGQTLTAGDLTPYYATATYHWQRYNDASGGYVNISGAVSNTYVLTAEDFGKTIRVMANGSGNYTGTVTSAPTAAASKGQITGISPIIGSAIPGQVLTAGTVTPLGATVDYQWQHTNWDGTSYEDVGTNTSTFTVMTDYRGGFIRLVVTGKATYEGTVSVMTLTRVDSGSGTALTGIGQITGIPTVGRMLIAGALTPQATTATYQWQRSPTGEEGSFTDIVGAVSISYHLTQSDYDQYIRVTARGSGAYTGTVSAGTGKVGPLQITGIGPVIGSALTGETLTAGPVTPAGSKVTWQWQKAAVPGGPYTDVSGATTGIYILSDSDAGSYIKVKATGTSYTIGTATSEYTGPVGTSATQITGIGDITGLTRVGSALSAGALNPASATVTYQWQRSAAANGSYANILGAVSGTYTLAAADWNQYIRVIAMGSGAYAGTVASNPQGLVAACPLEGISAITGASKVDQTLTAGTVSPQGASFTYQWQRSINWNGTSYTDIPGANTYTYVLIGDDNGRYVGVKVMGTGAYAGETFARTAVQINSGNPINLISIGDIAGTPQAGQILTAGTLNPANVTVCYQWQRGISGTYEHIFGANTGTYALTEAESDYSIRVIATGTGNYTGTVYSNSVGPVLPMAPASAPSMIADELFMTEKALIPGMEGVNVLSRQTGLLDELLDEPAGEATPGPTEMPTETPVPTETLVPADCYETHFLWSKSIMKRMKETLFPWMTLHCTENV